MNHYLEQIYAAMMQNPALLDSFLKGKGAETVRAVCKGIDGKLIPQVTAQAEKNPVIQMYVGAKGDISAEELLALTGGFVKSEKSNPTNNPGVEALLTGEATAAELLKLKDIVSSSSTRAGNGDMLSTLLGLLAQSQQTQQAQQQNTTLTKQQLNQLMTLVYQANRNQNVNQTVTLTAGQLNQLIRAYGVNTNNKPQTQQTQSSNGGLSQILSLLAGGNQAAQSSSQQQDQMQQLLNLLGGSQQTATNQSSGLEQLFGLGTNQTQQGFNLNQAPQQSSSLNGQVFSLDGSSGGSSGSSLGNLFSLAGQLLGH
jgi:hypothetical protein